MSFLKYAAMTSVAALGLAQAANAATFTFTFDDRADNLNSQYFLSNEDPSFGVTVEGFYYSKAGTSYVQGGAADVDTNAWGLISDNDDQERYDWHYIDSKGVNESMKFTFDGGREVSLTDVVVSYSRKQYCQYGGGCYSHYSTSGDGNAFYDVFADGELAYSKAPWTADMATGEANTFAVGATEYWGNNGYKVSGIKISSITVEYTETPPGGVIPLPAGAPLLIGGLGALALLRRRKKA